MYLPLYLSLATKANGKQDDACSRVFGNRFRTAPNLTGRQFSSRTRALSLANCSIRAYFLRIARRCTPQIATNAFSNCAFGLLFYSELFELFLFRLKPGFGNLVHIFFSSFFDGVFSKTATSQPNRLNFSSGPQNVARSFRLFLPGHESAEVRTLPDQADENSRISFKCEAKIVEESNGIEGLLFFFSPTSHHCWKFSRKPPFFALHCTLQLLKSFGTGNPHR